MRFRLAILVGLTAAASAVEPLAVCATTTDLGDLARTVGGPDVAVTVFARGGDDPHFVEPRPSFIKALAKAELVVAIGMELEIGWLPTIVSQARNPRLGDGLPGRFEASSAIAPLGAPVGHVDRSHGDVHAGGNPHFLCDPVCGVQVAKALSGRIGQLRPAIADACRARYRAFAGEVARRLLGPALVDRVGEEQAIAGLESDRLAPLIGDGSDLGGWLGLLRPCAGMALIADHDMWPYLARRYDIRIVGFLEPKPGVPPSSRHLADVIQLARSRRAQAIITVPYFDRRSSDFVAAEAGIPVLLLAHQVGATAEASGWMALVGSHAERLATLLPSRP